MTTYPDPYDAANAKRGSDHERAAHWRELAMQERAVRREAEAVLREIAEGRGRFSLDPLTHATNTIEDMKAIALRALARHEEADHD
jgi:hypothetical protein